MATIFITTKYLADNSVINKNVDTEVILPFIIKSQLNRIKPLLGTALSDKLENDVSGKTLTGNYKILMDEYIRPTLVEWVIYDSMPFINFKFTNKGIIRKTGENSETSELNEIRFLRNVVRDSAESLSQGLIKYLKSNTTLFPEYVNPGSSIDTIVPISSNFFSGLYLP